jgi:hypothetical protein
VDTQFADGINALCWPRELPGAFEELASQFCGDAALSASGVQTLSVSRLSQLRLSSAARLAIAAIEKDLECLQEYGLQPELNWVGHYPRDQAAASVATDVYSFHADRAPVEVDTWLCTYSGAPTEGLRNDQALQRVSVPATRAALLREFGGIEGEAFEAFLRENSYDLHYAMEVNASPWSFGVGCLWRVAVSWPGSLVPPCIHRAPVCTAAAGRLLLIS